jgi:hypothetical protein
MTEQIEQAQLVADQNMDDKKTETIAQKISSHSTLLIFVIVVAVGAATLIAWNKGGLFNGSSSAYVVGQGPAISNIVYLDMSGIISAATKRFLEQKDNPKADPSLSGKEFSIRLASILDEYKRAGVIVVDQQYVLAAPDGHDITREVAAKLDLTLEK